MMNAILTTPRNVISEQARVRMETLINPDMSKLSSKNLLCGLIPEGWSEQVFEYDDKFFINLTISKAISRNEEFEITKLIAKELGTDNLIFPNVMRNTINSSAINIQLKKSNYE